MRQRAFIAPPVLALVLAALPAAPEEPAGAPPPGEAVKAADRALAAAVAAGDAEAFGALLADDALFLGGGVLRGRQAVVAGWAPFLEEGGRMRLAWEPAEAVVAASGDRAYTVGDYTLTARGEDGSESVTPGRYVSVWTREGDGPWRVAADGSLAEDAGRSAAALLEHRSGTGPGAAVTASWRPVRTLTAASGELAVDLGTYRVEAGEMAAGEAPAAAAGAYFTVWRREADGAWTLAAESASPPAPPGG
jgi:uncharacterized protein (TIGR02246 family)